MPNSTYVNVKKTIHTSETIQHENQLTEMEREQHYPSALVI